MKTVLITGANSGVGFECVEQFSKLANPPENVILCGRSAEKINDAIHQFATMHPNISYIPLILDLCEYDDFNLHAFDNLPNVDVLILNAAVLANPPRWNSKGIEVTYATTLLGHHVLLGRLLQKSHKIKKIIWSGSESIRDDLMGIRTYKYLTHDNFNPEEVMHSHQIDALTNYATAKLFGTMWVRYLAKKGYDVVSVSPGTVVETQIIKELPLYKRVSAKYVLGLFRAHSVEVGARRYMECLENTIPGEFYASKPNEVTGPLCLQNKTAMESNDSLLKKNYEIVEKLTNVHV